MIDWLASAGAGERATWMQIGRLVRRKLRAAAAPAVFLLLIVYFLWNATQGAHGLRAYADAQRELEAAKAEQARAEADLAVWQRRVAGLRNPIDGDALDERARAMLNLSDPRDVIVPYEKGRRLF